MQSAYHRPATLDDALAIRAGGDVMVMAGRHGCLPAKAARAGWGDMRHKDVLDISRSAELRGIADEGDHWRIGALTTWSEVIAPSCRRCSTA
jgi:N-methylhydantoinase B